VARLNDVDAFGYNSAGSERIWMKFGARRAHCLELALADFGRDSRKSESGSTCQFFCQVSNERFHRLTVSQISRSLHTTRTWICVAMNPFETNF